jgi:isopenicillin N synthase-like dioxygenase
VPEAGKSEIPVIDIRPDADGNPRREAITQLGAACEGIGFFVIGGHGIGPELISPMMQAARDFFGLDEDVKKSYLSPTGNKFRGYTAATSYKGGPPDVKEGFQVSWFENRGAMIEAGYAAEYADSFEPNIWPSSPAGFRSAWQRYFVAVKEVGDYILELAALALDLPKDWFEPKFSRQSSYLLANYYPAQADVVSDGRQRLHPHTDYGAFTILYQDVAIGGLEVQTREGSWARVPYIPGTFVVNLGDLLAKWTNDRWVATPHRVRNPEPDELGQDRISVPFFQHPNLDALIETIPTCIAAGDRPHHPPVLWRDWGAYRMADFDEVKAS